MKKTKSQRSSFATPANTYKYRFSFQLKVIALSGLIMVTFLLMVVGLAYRTMRTTAMNKAIDAMKSSVKSVANGIEHTIDLVEIIGLNIIGNTNIKQSIDLQADTLSRTDSYFIKTELMNALRNYGLLTDEIAAIVWTSTDFESTLCCKDIAIVWNDDTRLWTQVLANQNGETWAISEENEGVLCCIWPVRSADYTHLIGTLTIYFYEPKLCSLYDELLLTENAQVYIADADGVIVSSNDKESLRQAIDPQLLLHSRQDVALDMDSDPVVLNRTLSNGWRLVNSVPRSYCLSETSATLRVFLLTALLLGSAGIFLLVLAMRRVVAPISELEHAMRVYGQGNFQARSSYAAHDEIGMLSATFNQMVEDCNQLREQIVEQRIRQKNAELQYLQMQIRPHFLFNVLDSIHWSAMECGAQDAAVMTRALGVLLRSSLDEQSFITLGEELENLNSYLTIQKMRYGENLSVVQQIPEALLSMHVPKLILQPIVENAIVHGIAEKEEGGTVRITAQQSPDGVLIIVEDTGVGMSEKQCRELLGGVTKTKQKKAHIGIENVQKRLQLHYGAQYSLKIESRLGEWTRVSLPLRNITPEPSK